MRTDAEAFVVLDVSRSMLAQPISTTAAAGACEGCRDDAPCVHVRRTRRRGFTHGSGSPAPLPEHRPGRLRSDAGTFAWHRAATTPLVVRHRSNVAERARALRGLRYFTPTSEKRLAIVLTDGEPARRERAPRRLLRRPPAIEVVFVQFWDEDERVFSRGVPEPEYIADPSARAALDRLAHTGAVYSEDQLQAAAGKARDLLASGPSTSWGRRRAAALAPYPAAAALLPFGLILWRRDR